MTRPVCPLCGHMLVPPVGPIGSALLVGEFPGKLEIAKGIPWVGDAGQVLDEELRRQGLVLSNFRRTNLWQHAPVPEKDLLYPHELEWHRTALFVEMRKAKIVLLMGSTVCWVLLDRAVSDTTGLEVKIPGLPDETRVFVSVNPAIAMHGLVGEVRHAIQQFANALTAQVS